MQLESFYAQIDAPYREVLERFCNDEGMLEMFVGSFPKDMLFSVHRGHPSGGASSY